MRIFLSNPEVEFLNTGAASDVLTVPHRKVRDVMQDVLAGRYDLIFAGNNAFPYPNPRKLWIKNLANLAWEVARQPNLLAGGRFPYARVGSRLAGIDMDDRPVIDNRWFSLLDACVCFFKRELPQNPCNAFLYTSARTECNGNVLHLENYRRWMAKLRPISMGIAPEICAQYSALEVPKKTDVFFAGDTTNRPNRIAGLRQLELLAKAGYSIDLVRGKVPREEFFLRCAQAHIVWSPEGFGWDCWRHYEVGLLGSVPLMQSPTIQRYAPLAEDEHALYYFIEGDHLARRIRQALQNKPRLVEMGRAARAHVLRHHTYEALGRYVIEETRRSQAIASANGGAVTGGEGGGIASTAWPNFDL